MDPLTAFGIACNVMKVVRFGHEIFSLAQCIAKDGSPDASLGEKSARLFELSKELQGSLQMQQLTCPLTERQQRLQKVAKKCLSSAQSLAEELDKIKWKTGTSGSNPRTQRWLLRQTWKAWWGKTKIDKLQKEMTEVEQSMQSTILVDLWLSEEAAVLQHEEDFKLLDDRLQHFIQQYAQGYTQLSDLVGNHATTIKEEVRSESAETRVHVSVQLQAQEVARATKDQCEIFLKSLTYESMNVRRSRIAESHQKTFHWIFDDTTSLPWGNFSEWLKSPQRIYWISGKAGSGKSTLMKFLVDDQRTRHALDKWTTNSTIISFFLWNAGNPLQRSVQGLLCSLLHQLLMTDQSLITGLIGVQPQLLSKKNHGDWSDKELEQVFILGISMSMRPLCVFLDGLDEIDRGEGFDYVVNLIEQLQSKSSAKLCVSSRPEPALQDAFNRYPKLRLQDLTKSDISFFVTSFLEQSNFHFWDENVDNDKKKQQIVDEVVGNADGVFLWVHIVVKSLRRGTAHFDSSEQILDRIRELPKTLEGLYKEAWDRLGEDESRYRAEAARYFRLVLEARGFDNEGFSPSFSLLDLSMASDDKIQSAFLDNKIIPPVTILLQKAWNCHRRVESCCGGLLEFWEGENETGTWKPQNQSSLNNLYCEFLMPLSAYVTTSPSARDANIPEGKDLRSLWNIFYNVKVDFIHRTAADFLVATKSGRNIISSDPASASDITAKIFHSQLIRTLLFYFPWHSGRRHGSAVPLHWLDRLGGSIPDEMQKGLQILVGDIYHRLLDRASVIEFIIKELRFQIRNGQFDGSFYNVLHDFTNSIATTPKYLLHLCPYLHTVEDANLIVDVGTNTWKSYQMVRYLRDACTQILAKYESMSTTDLWRDVNWPVEIPKIEVLCHADVSSDTLWDRVFAHLLVTRWILVDARRCLRCRTAEMATDFLRKVVRDGLVEVAQRWFTARPGPYDGTTIFNEMPLDYAKITPEMQELLERLLKSGVKVADGADRVDGRGHPSASDGFSGRSYALESRRTIYKAIVLDLAESDDSEDDGSNSWY